MACPGIYGVHDIVIHNYGPDRYFATAHAEVERDGDRVTVHDQLEAAEAEIERTMPVQLSLHCDPYVSGDERLLVWRRRLENELARLDPHLKSYNLRLMERPPDGSTVLRFYLLIPGIYGWNEERIQKHLEAVLKKYD